jgi:hypothetical protein
MYVDMKQAKSREMIALLFSAISDDRGRRKSYAESYKAMGELILMSDNDTIIAVVTEMAFLGTCDLGSIFTTHVENGRPPSRANYRLSAV